MSPIVEIGKTYDLHHSRKGQFSLRVTGLSGEFAIGIITAGRAKTALAYNEAGPGEELTVRISMATWKEVA